MTSLWALPEVLTATGAVRPGEGPAMAALEWYAHKALGDGVFWIQERFYESGNRANIWLVHGSHQDLVIDTGLGLRSLPDYLCAAGLLPHGKQGGSGRRPLMAVATHVHFDHAGGLHQFEQVAVHRDEADALIRGDNFETVTWLSDSEVVKPPSPGWSASQFKVQAVTPSHILEDGDIISLGDRQLTVMHMPGHSRGSICLHDRDRKILFSGDVAYDGSMIDWLPYSNIPEYVRSCERLKGLVDRGLVDKVLPGHFNTFWGRKTLSFGFHIYSKCWSLPQNVHLCSALLCWISPPGNKFSENNLENLGNANEERNTENFYANI